MLLCCCRINRVIQLLSLDECNYVSRQHCKSLQCKAKNYKSQHGEEMKWKPNVFCTQGFKTSRTRLQTLLPSLITFKDSHQALQVLKSSALEKEGEGMWLGRVRKYVLAGQWTKPMCWIRKWKQHADQWRICLLICKGEPGLTTQDKTGPSFLKKNNSQLPELCSSKSYAENCSLEITLLKVWVGLPEGGSHF